MGACVNCVDKRAWQFGNRRLHQFQHSLTIGCNTGIGTLFVSMCTLTMLREERITFEESTLLTHTGVGGMGMARGAIARQHHKGIQRHRKKAAQHHYRCRYFAPNLHQRPNYTL